MSYHICLIRLLRTARVGLLLSTCWPGLAYLNDTDISSLQLTGKKVIKCDENSTGGGLRCFVEVLLEIRVFVLNYHIFYGQTSVYPIDPYQFLRRRV